MTKRYLTITMIVLALILLAVNVIFTADQMDRGFWLRIVSSVLLIISMVLALRAQKRENS